MTTSDVAAPPVVSAITIFYNGGRFLADAIESVLAQTYRSWELLLVDDGSTDAGTEVARDYAAHYPDRIRYLEHSSHRNRGMSASRNVGLQHSRGSLVAFLDCDDIWLPKKLERQVAILEEHAEAQMTCGPTRVWYGWTGDPSDAERDSLHPITAAPEGLYAPPEMLRRYLHGDALTPATCSVLMRREALSLTGRFEERFKGLYEDQAFFVKAYHKLRCWVSSEVLDLYRQHDDSYCAEALRTGEYSLDEPTAALTGLYLWCARYFVRERVRDRRLWSELLSQLVATGRYRFAHRRHA